MDFIDGVQAAGTVDKFRPRTAEQTLGRAASLQELRKDFAFYTPAIPDRFGMWHEHPLVTLGKALNQVLQPKALRFDKPVFSGFGEPYDYLVFAIEREHWEALANQIRGTTMIDRQNRRLLQLRLRELTIVDPLEQQRRGFSSGLATQVTAICGETNKGCYYVDDSAGLQSLPVFRYTTDTFPDFIEQAERLLGPVRS